MANWIKLGVYVAAGVGTYEILRRYGLLQKAGDWLSQQVPDEFKDQARDYAGQLRDRAGGYGERAQKWANDATESVRGAVGSAAASATAGGSNSGSNSGSNPSDHTGGPQNLTGAGRGTSTTTDEPNGTHVTHTVGRGVVR